MVVRVGAAEAYLTSGEVNMRVKTIGVALGRAASRRIGSRPATRALSVGAALSLLVFLGAHLRIYASTTAETIDVSAGAASGPAGIQEDSTVAGGFVAYSDYNTGTGNGDIWVYDLAGGTYELVAPLAADGSTQVLPDIDAGVVVYSDDRLGDFDIYAYNLATGVETLVAGGPGDQIDAAISGNRVVWTQNDGTEAIDFNIYAGCVTSCTPVRLNSGATSSQSLAEVAGDVVVWQDFSAGNGDVYAYWFAGAPAPFVDGAAQLIASGPAGQIDPDVTTEYAVYEGFDAVSNSWNVYVYDFASTGTFALTSSAGNQRNPRASGDLIVWQDDRAGSIDLYGCRFDPDTIDIFDPATFTCGPEFTVMSGGILHDVNTRADGYDIAYTFEIGAGDSDIRVLRVTIDPTDTTPPVASPAHSPLANSEGWNTTDVTVTWNWSDGTGSGIDADNCTTGTSSLGEGTLVLNATCKDLAGNIGNASHTVHIDQTPPDVAVTGVSDGATYLPGSVPAAGCSTTDALSGVQTAAVLNSSGGPVGAIMATCSGATDIAGNAAAAESVTYAVMYGWTGFFQPVDNMPTLNTARAGASVPIKFDLGGNQGLNIFAPNSPSSGVVPCGATGPESAIEETATAGGSTLTYANDQYTYVWKTDKSWVGQCRQLTLKLVDGTEHKALFKFK